jgi:ribosomal protein L11 methyltransferase
MDYIELSCKLDPLEPWREILIAQLAGVGFESFEETYDGLKAYIPSASYDEKQLSEALQTPEGEVDPVVSRQVNSIATMNWNEEWESKFEPILVDDQVFIRAPFHHERPDMTFDIVIEPKMSFGTGHHETTRLMVQWLLDTDLQGKSVLDMGCGTGILAILSAKNGAASVTAIDNYVFAYENAIDNANRNGHPDILVKHGDASLLGRESFDIIIANITRNVLLEDMQTYCSVLRKDGVMLLSGFLEVDRDLIVNHAGTLGLIPDGEKKIDDWVGLRLRRKR